MYCNKCHGLYFGDPTAMGPIGGICPKDGKAHHSINKKSYLLATGSNAKGQENWRHCNKCHLLYFGGLPNSKCPAGGSHQNGGGPPQNNGGRSYVLAHAPNSPGQDNWRWCSKCQGLYLADQAGSKCPADNGQHGSAVSHNYVLEQMGPGEVETNWRWCSKCHGLFDGDDSHFGSSCPTGGTHFMIGSFNFVMLRDYNPATVPGQDNWRRCHKCMGLYFAGNPGSKCPRDGGSHLSTGGNYILPRNSLTPKAPGQSGWRWCKKCQGLFYGKQSGSKCPADGTAHTAVGSGDYALLTDGCNDC
jgi:hypothetical protein